MNKRIMKAKLLQIQGKSKSTWGRLANNRRNQLMGRLTLWDGKLREHYYYEYARVSRGIDKGLAGFRGRLRPRRHIFRNR